MLGPSACASKPGFTGKEAENTRRSPKFEQASSAPLTFKIGLSRASGRMRVCPKWARSDLADPARATAQRMNLKERA